jgi:hypothetical protein
MVLKGLLYNTVFRRNSTYAAFIVAGAVLGEKFLNDVVDSHWRDSNRGVWLPVLVFALCSVFASSARFFHDVFLISYIFQKLFNDQEFAKSQ